MKIIIFTGMLLSCVSLYTPEIYEKDGLITLGLYTGSHGSSFYAENFHKAAKSRCKKYSVLEITDFPSTLEAEEIRDNWFYWVIKCI
jgi:hypothetical protein